MLRNYIDLSCSQALDLEQKLNLSKNSRKWIQLGNVLYAWRLDPDYFEIKFSKGYDVSLEQFEWVINNIKEDNNKTHFKLFVYY
tara:strand:+ start:600 stop:851 length:252 start_codon:yes stop_codon:yes gene_type:complete